jgi:hypothetical protein
VSWTGALRRSETVALTTEDVQFVEGEGVNVCVRRSKSDQEGTGLVKGLPYGSNKETYPVTAPRQWLQAAEAEVEGAFEGDIFRRFYRGESIGESAMTAQCVSTVLKRHAEGAGLDPEAYSGHASWETSNRCARGGGDLSGQPRRGDRALNQPHRPNSNSSGGLAREP